MGFFQAQTPEVRNLHQLKDDLVNEYPLATDKYSQHLKENSWPLHQPEFLKLHSNKDASGNGLSNS